MIHPFYSSKNLDVKLQGFFFCLVRFFPMAFLNAKCIFFGGQGRLELQRFGGVMWDDLGLEDFPQGPRIHRIDSTSKIIMSKLGGGADIYSPGKRTNVSWKSMVGRSIPYWNCPFFRDMLVFRGVPQMFFFVPWQLWFFDVLRFEADESILNLTANLTANFKHQFCEDHFPHAASAQFRLRYLRILWSPI